MVALECPGMFVPGDPLEPHAAPVGALRDAADGILRVFGQDTIRVAELPHDVAALEGMRDVRVAVLQLPAPVAPAFGVVVSFGRDFGDFQPSREFRFKDFAARLVDGAADDPWRRIVRANRRIHGGERPFERGEHIADPGAVDILREVYGAGGRLAYRHEALLARADIAVEDDGERVVALERPAAAREVLRRRGGADFAQRGELFRERLDSALGNEDALLRGRQRGKRPQVVADGGGVDEVDVVHVLLPFLVSRVSGEQIRVLFLLYHFRQHLRKEAACALLDAA